MSLVDIIFLGLIEGITEFLPISSTGHLILSARLLELESSEFLKTFEIAIQLGAILSVVVLYWRMLLTRRDVIMRVNTAFIPTAVLGLLFYSNIKSLLDSTTIVLWALGLGGVVLLFFDKLVPEKAGDKKDIGQLTLGQSLSIGLVQAVSMVPGVSRAAATIIGGRLNRLSRRAAVEFSFLLAVPTMAVATGLDLYKNAGQFSNTQWGQLFVGGGVSFVVALLAMRFLLRYVKTHDFNFFGWYRIVVAVLFWLILV